MAPANRNSGNATIVSSRPNETLGAEEILSEAEINDLLKEAETRLRQQSSALVKADSISALTSLPKLKADVSVSPYLQEQNGVVRTDASKLIDDQQRKLAEELYVPELKTKKDSTKTKENAGQDWFDMPKTDLTPQLKRDLRLLQMRSVLDPHRHYKNTGKGKVPAFSQVGTVIEGAAEFYSARLNKRDRKQTLADEIMAGEKENGRFKRKYNEIQEAKTSGKRAYYKKVKDARKRK